MDYIILRLTGMFRKKQRNITSYLLGSFVGAMMLTLFMISPVRLGIVGKIAAYFAVSFLMCMVTFGMKNGKDNLKSWICLYLMAFGAGGIMNSIYFHTDMKLSTFFLSAGISWMILKSTVNAVHTYMSRTGTQNDIVEVTLFHKGKSISLPALFDSGNSLTEPISGMPVHIIETMTAENLIKEEGGDTQEKIRLVPYHSLGKEDGMMTAFLCDKLVLRVKEKEIDLGATYLAIYTGNLCGGKKYKMILNRSIKKWL